MVNLKAYPEWIGEGALRLGRILDRQARRAGVASAIAAPAPDLAPLARALRIPVLAQHTDSSSPGARTGHLVAESIRAAGALGSLVNHSERALTMPEVGAVVERLRETGLVPVVCARDVDDARSLARFRPPYLAVEPPELIGGDRSVSTARPEVISGTVDAVRSVSPTTHVLCGAGVHDRSDVRIALELGSVGVLVASAVTLSKDPEAAIVELLSGYPAAPVPARRRSP